MLFCCLLFRCLLLFVLCVLGFFCFVFDFCFYVFFVLFCFFVFFCFFFWGGGGGRLCTVNVTDIKVINVIKQFQSEILNHLPLAFFELSGNF